MALLIDRPGSSAPLGRELDQGYLEGEPGAGFKFGRRQCQLAGSTLLAHLDPSRPLSSPTGEKDVVCLVERHF